MTEEPTKISASQVSLILQRAAEIDARGDTLTIDELHRIAAEAGIDRQATSRAIREILSDEEPGAAVEPAEPAGPPARPARYPSPGRILAGGAVGTVLGFLTSLANDAPFPGDLLAMAWLGFGGTMFYLLVRALNSMKRKTQFVFQIENFALWFGGAVGAWAMDILWTEEVLGMALAAWFLTSVVGGILVKFGPREEEDGTHPRHGSSS